LPASAYTNIKLYTQANGGLSVARNTTLDHASGDYISFVDSDDFLIPHTVKKVLGIAEQNQVDICVFKLLVECRTHSGHCLGDFGPMPIEKVMSGTEAIFGGVAFSSVCGSLFSKKFIDNFGLRFTLGITHQDGDFNMRAFSVAQRVIFLNNTCYYYFRNNQSLTRSRTLETRIKLLKDDIVLCENANKISQINISTELQEFYKRRSKSSVVALLLNLSKPKCDDFGVDVKKEFVQTLKDKGLYPVQGRTLSWKTTLLAKLLNNKLILNHLLKIK